MEVSKMTEPGLGCKKSLELYAHHKSLQTKKDSLKGSRRD